MIGKRVAKRKRFLNDYKNEIMRENNQNSKKKKKKKERPVLQYCYVYQIFLANSFSGINIIKLFRYFSNLFLIRSKGYDFERKVMLFTKLHHI